ncbi:MAG: hypothetical protein AABW61_01960, partial [Candidatus Aenigmatarchaeota archaeon]
FMVDKDKPQFKDNCLIYTVDEIGAASRTIEARDEAFIYYVKAGTVIQNQGCTSLGDCLSGKIFDSGCEEGKERSNLCEISGAGLGDLDKCYGKKKGPFTTVNCYCESKVATIFPNEKSKCEDSKRDVETFPFGKEIKREEDCELKDGRPKTPSKCNLLVPEDRFTIKFGLLCDDSKVWRTCKENSKGEFTPNKQADGRDYKCDKTSDNIYFWEPTTSTPTPSPTHPPTNVQLSSTSVSAVNLAFSLRISAEDKDSGLSYLHLNLDDQGDKTGKCESAEARSDLENNGRTLVYRCSGGKCETNWKIICSKPDAYKFQGQAVDSTGLYTISNIYTMLVTST